jgi:hypothetical protein
MAHLLFPQPSFGVIFGSVSEVAEAVPIDQNTSTEPASACRGTAEQYTVQL